MNQPTKTINRIHFSDLDPYRFEDLCLALVTRMENWKELIHPGRMGSDGGIDIIAFKEENDQVKKWYIQCKRYIKITKLDLKEIIEKVTVMPPFADKLLLIVACDISMTLIQYFKDYSKEKGINESEVWTASIIESKLYNVHKDLLFVYFGISFANRKLTNVARTKHYLRMEKRVYKELIDYKFINDPKNRKQILYDPSSRFISSEVFIRSIDDTSYPENDQTSSSLISSWFRTYFYDTYFNGIEFWLDAVCSTLVIIDKDGKWEPLDDNGDMRKKNPFYQVILAKQIGRIPYFNIIDFKTDGDEFSSVPHLFCQYDDYGSPFEEIYFKSHGDPSKQISDYLLDKKMRVKFPKDF